MLTYVLDLRHLGTYLIDDAQPLLPFSPPPYSFIRSHSLTSSADWVGLTSNILKMKTVAVDVSWFLPLLLVCYHFLNTSAFHSHGYRFYPNSRPSLPSGRNDRRSRKEDATPMKMTATCVYEVNCVVDKDISEEFLAFLIPHAKEVADLEGFIDHEILLTEAQSGSETEEVVRYTAIYRLDTRKSLQRYFDVDAERLRGDTMQRFEGKFSATRRIHRVISPIS